MKNNVKHILKIGLISLLPPILIYIPLILKIDKLLFLELNKDGMLNIFRNWDGPLYLTVAKSLYDPKIIEKLLFNPLPAVYFAAHFPLYPILIKLFTVIARSPLYSALIINLLAGFFLNLIFFEFIKKRSKSPYFLTFVFTILPARGFITRVILAPESLMLLLTLLSIIEFKKKRYVISSVYLTLAVLTKFQIIILLFAYGTFFVIKFLQEKKIKDFVQNSIVFLLPGVAIIILFYFYKLRFGNFLAFFEAEKANRLTTSFPFSQFNFRAPWIRTIWLEDLIFYYLFMALLSIKFFEIRKKHLEIFLFVTFYAAFLSLIPQKDITRFSLPLTPFFYYAFANFFDNKVFKLAFIFILPAVYFYTLNFILVNQAPVMDWTHILN